MCTRVYICMWVGLLTSAVELLPAAAAFGRPREGPKAKGCTCGGGGGGHTICGQCTVHVHALWLVAPCARSTADRSFIPASANMLQHFHTRSPPNQRGVPGTRVISLSLSLSLLPLPTCCAPTPAHPHATASTDSSPIPPTTQQASKICSTYLASICPRRLCCCCCCPSPPQDLAVLVDQACPAVGLSPTACYCTEPPASHSMLAAYHTLTSCNL